MTMTSGGAKHDPTDIDLYARAECATTRGSLEVISIVDCRSLGGCHKERVRSTRLAQERRKTGGDVCILADCASEGISRMPEGQPHSDRVAHSTPFSLAQARAWSEACLMASSPKPSGLNAFCFTFPSEV